MSHSLVDELMMSCLVLPCPALYRRREGKKALEYPLIISFQHRTSVKTFVAEFDRLTIT